MSTQSSTTEDRHRYLTGGLVPVHCRTCGTEVLARKNSRLQTSIQWTTSARDACPEIGSRVASGVDPACVDTCPKLRESIATAVKKGELTVTDPTE